MAFKCFFTCTVYCLEVFLHVLSLKMTHVGWNMSLQ